MQSLICRVGRYAGEVVEYPDHIAEHMLATGRAEPLPPDEDDEQELEAATAPDAGEIRADEPEHAAEAGDGPARITAQRRRQRRKR
jgi:hypothetical protein